ncbi:uncharacterized protein LOC110981397 [Acanthaster planci]|uniref:Phospholipase B1, membrane-associated n=1 Tax=Acanthaster planci TaxID=133434 RepID=A0A8B7YTE6_ACAPL|nr:uncharacterized protein LOC110981397 [Acanthaster planci]
MIPLNKDAEIEVLLGRDAPQFHKVREVINGKDDQPWVHRPRPRLAVAISCLRKNCEEGEPEFDTDVRELIEGNFNMDDLLMSLPIKEEEVDENLLSTANSRLHKFFSSDANVLAAFEHSKLAPNLAPADLSSKDESTVRQQNPTARVGMSVRRQSPSKSVSKLRQTGYSESEADCRHLNYHTEQHTQLYYQRTTMSQSSSSRSSISSAATKFDTLHWPFQVTAPDGPCDPKDLLRSHWRLVQHLSNMFWDKWRKAFLPLLQTRVKWQQPKRDLKDVVIVKCDSRQYDWPLGKAFGFEASGDGHITKASMEMVAADQRSPFLQPTLSAAVFCMVRPGTDGLLVTPVGQLKTRTMFSDNIIAVTRVLTTLAAFGLTAFSIELDHENWREFKSAIMQGKISSGGQRAACNEPFKHRMLFDCDVETSSQVPKSVHMLTPANVKVIGAIGDSITAANGALACNLLEVVNEYRGVSWSIGGDYNLTEALTLPNILKNYNPELMGYSLGIGNVTSDISNFNLAVPGSIASDMPGQAEELVNRIFNHPDVAYADDWKVVTLFVGGNDICEHCENPSNYTVEDYVFYITKALDHLHEKLPRTFVNVVGLLNITELVLQEQFICKLVHRILCGCILQLSEEERLALEELNREYQDGLEALVNSGRYDTRDDFTVVYQPFMEETRFPVGDVNDHVITVAAANNAAYRNSIHYPIRDRFRSYILDLSCCFASQDQKETLFFWPGDILIMFGLTRTLLSFQSCQDGKVDQSYMAPDCFHLSAKGHAFAARELWNNMLQPIGQKSSAWDPNATDIPCPTKERPYFATAQNSLLTTSESHVTSGGIRTGGVRLCGQLLFLLQLALALLFSLKSRRDWHKARSVVTQLKETCGDSRISCVFGHKLGCQADFEHDYDGVFDQDYSDLNRTIQDLITLLPGYNCTGDPSWPYGEVQIFPCEILPPSQSVPNSVHRLRPADINVIGAIGDSLSAASGGGACSLPQMLLQYRGKAFSHGGDDSYETVPTLANIFRKYNPNLKGYGVGTGGWSSQNAGMNVAIPGAVALDIPEQAENLVQKMKDDASIDFDKDWKLVTIFIGGNDLCAVCKDKEKYSPSAYIGNIQRAIRVLHDQLPRTLVSVVGILDLRELNLLPGLLCDISHRIFCPCVANATETELQNEWLPILQQYQDMLEGMVTSGMFDDKDDFTAVYQPFFHETKLPLVDGSGDISYMAPDCFHFGAKGHAETGNCLWNNMVQPVGSKARAWVPDGPFTCPTEVLPFIYTNLNSRQAATTDKPAMTSTDRDVVITTMDTGSGDSGSASKLALSFWILIMLEFCFVFPSLQFEYDYDGVIGDDYNDWNRTIRDLITLLPGYNCTGDPTWPYGEQQIFPCQILPPSESPPNSVHMLRPADIKVIGAIGDSLTAANGGGACSLPQLLYQYRGKSFSHGGDESYETVPTLANILRKYNPSLKGYGVGTGSWFTSNAGMNVAFPGAVAYEIEEQAERLVQKMKDEASVDYEKDWKLITIFIGGNDLCDLCNDKTLYSPGAYVNNVRRALQVLHNKMPRTFVNVIGILDLRQINEFEGFVCKASHRGFCPCVANVPVEELENEWTPTLLQYQIQLEALIGSGTFDDKEDFTVVYQPFLHDSKIPLIEGSGDLSYMAPDCFHFSAKGHAETAKGLWNNMMQPVGSKVTSWEPNGAFTCPSEVTLRS